MSEAELWERIRRLEAQTNALRTGRETPDATVIARYKTETAQVVEDATATRLNFGVKSIDTHNCVVTGVSWEFTCKIPGYYTAKCAIMLASWDDWAPGDYLWLGVSKNDAQYSYLDRKDNLDSGVTGYALYMQLGGSDEVYLAVGDTLYFNTWLACGGNRALHIDWNFNYCSIKLTRI